MQDTDNKFCSLIIKVILLHLFLVFLAPINICWSRSGVILNDTFDYYRLNLNVWQNFSEAPAGINIDTANEHIEFIGVSGNYARILSKESLWAAPQSEEILRVTFENVSTNNTTTSNYSLWFWNGKSLASGQGIWMGITTGHSSNTGKATFYLYNQNTGFFDTYLMWNAYSMDGNWVIEWEESRVKVYRLGDVFFDSDIHAGQESGTLAGEWEIPNVPLGISVERGITGGATVDSIRMVWAPECGENGYLKSDLNEDCKIDFVDVDMQSEMWLEEHSPGVELPSYQNSRGYRILRGLPLTITGLSAANPILDYDTQRFKDAGFNVFMDYSHGDRAFTNAIDANLPWLFWKGWDGVTIEEVDRYAKWPGLLGFIVMDEPPWDTNEARFQEPISVIQYIKDNYPDKLCYINVGFSTGDPESVYNDFVEYVDNVGDMMQPDVLSIDSYIFIDGDLTREKTYWIALSTVREKAIEMGVPYWCWFKAQSITYNGWRAISESDLRYSIFKPLAFGYKGLQYHTYDKVGTVLDGLIDTSTGQPNYLYWYAQKVNQEVTNIGQALTHLKSTSVYHAGPDNPWPAYAPDFMSDGNINSFDAQGSNWTIGFFKDSRNEEYFMIVNNEHHQDVNAADCNKTCKVYFNNSVNSLKRINRQTGIVETLNLSDNSLDLTLPGGTGDLFKYDTGTSFVEPLCGDYGYDIADINKDCIVNLEDFAQIASVWQLCTHGIYEVCEDFYDCQQFPGKCKWLEKNWRLVYQTISQ